MKILSPLAAAGLLLACSNAMAATTLVTMTFDNGAANINELTGWNGTTAPGGYLDSGLTVSDAMKVTGNFGGQNQNDVFHVDNWHTTNSASTSVGFTIAAQPLYSFDLSGETFSTKLHYHYTGGNVSNIFNTVELKITDVSTSTTYSAGTQAFNYLLGPQTLNWTMPSGLDNLTNVHFALYFTGGTDPGNNNSGPEWSKLDGAFVTFSGTIVPEPSRALLGFLGLALVAFRRRR